MSEDNAAVDTSLCCSSCGITAVDEVKLKECAECDLVRYCSDECLKEHKLQHKEACEKRAAELRDELLFKQPESSHLGDCPICMIPLPLYETKSTINQCCSKTMCTGCNYANQMREIEGSLQQRCPFCRKPMPSNAEECDKQRMKRIQINDPVAICREGFTQYDKGDYLSAFEYYTRAAGLGDVDAHYRLGRLYHFGHGVEKDIEKEMYHLEQATIGGHPTARHNIGAHEWTNGKMKRAVKHMIIAATQGNDSSIKALMEMFKGGFVDKDDLAATLRAHQAAVNATKSPQREAAEEYYRNRRCK
eukprot:scaffold27815_cov78-Skeletonema_dohrnii-CCMP3373.AAC.1